MLNAQRGLSLLELILGLGLSSLLLLSVSTLLIHQQQLLSKQIKRVQLLIESQQLATYLRGEIQRSGHAQSSALEIKQSNLALGYQDEFNHFRRVQVWRDASQYKLKYCSDTNSLLKPLIETCTDNINYSMLNNKLLSAREFHVEVLSSDAGLLRIDYAVALKGEEALSGVIFAASRNKIATQQLVPIDDAQ